MNSRQAERASAGEMRTSSLRTSPGHWLAVAMSKALLLLLLLLTSAPPSLPAAALASASMSGAAIARMARSTSSPPA